MWDYISVRPRKQYKFTEKSDCISGNVGRVEVSYSMVETQSNENVQMSSSECRREQQHTVSYI